MTDGLAALAETCIALAAARGGAEPALHQRVHRACHTLSRYVSKSPVAAPRAALVAAQLYALRRENRAARAALRRALKAAQHFDMPYSEGLALQRLAPFEADPVQRQSLLDRAAERFADAGTLRAAGAEREPSSAPEQGLSPGQRASRH